MCNKTSSSATVLQREIYSALAKKKKNPQLALILYGLTTVWDKAT